MITFLKGILLIAAFFVAWYILGIPARIVWYVTDDDENYDDDTLSFWEFVFDYPDAMLFSPVLTIIWTAGIGTVISVIYLLGTLI